MQRKSQLSLTQVYKVFPWFVWRHCECCSQEFRRESGWRYIGGPYIGGFKRWRYICAECATSKGIAMEMANKMPNGLQPIKPPPPVLDVTNLASTAPEFMTVPVDCVASKSIYGDS